MELNIHLEQKNTPLINILNKKEYFKKEIDKIL